MSDIVERLLRFRPVYGWPEETSTVVEKSLNKVAVDEITRLRAQLHSEIVSHADMQKAYETERDVLREQRESLRAELAAVTEERDRLQIMHDEAYISGMKHGWNCCAAGEEERYKNSIENIREQIRRARALLDGERR